MTWFAVAACAWICFGREIGLKSALSLGPAGVAPSFVVPLAVFIGLSAPALHVLWGCLALGLVMDLTWMREQMTVGPYALGFLLAGYLTLNVRGLMIGRNPVTMTVMSVAFAAIVALVVSAATAARHWLWGAGALADASLPPRLGSALYTGAAGLVMFFALGVAAGAFQFQPATHRGWQARG
ncbi:MAG: hypothetical protein ACF8R7_15970 [Phycisphaerales bacterium JB039]